MAEHPKDGGPAFPSTHPSAPSYVGMSLHDWYAGQSLMGFRSNNHATGSIWAAKKAWEDAEAMIAEREKKQ